MIRVEHFALPLFFEKRNDITLYQAQGYEYNKETKVYRRQSSNCKYA